MRSSVSVARLDIHNFFFFMPLRDARPIGYGCRLRPPCASRKSKGSIYTLLALLAIQWDTPGVSGITASIYGGLA